MWHYNKIGNVKHSCILRNIQMNIQANIVRLLYQTAELTSHQLMANAEQTAVNLIVIAVR